MTVFWNVHVMFIHQYDFGTAKLTLWSRVFFEEVLPQLVKKLSACYGTLKFYTVFIIDRHLCQS
jgi:hypothetical protein